jgi:hypothetical protein
VKLIVAILIVVVLAHGYLLLRYDEVSACKAAVIHAMEELGYGDTAGEILLGSFTDPTLLARKYRSKYGLGACYSTAFLGNAGLPDEFVAMENAIMELFGLRDKPTLAPSDNDTKDEFGYTPDDDIGQFLEQKLRDQMTPEVD